MWEVTVHCGYCSSFFLCFPCRLKAGLSEKVLQEQGSRARKLWGDKMGLADFAQCINMPVTDMLQDMFDMIDEASLT